MSHDPLFSYLQVLNSINEMRQTIGAETGGFDSDFGQPATAWETPADTWFEDCEFDPRALSDD